MGGRVLADGEGNLLAGPTRRLTRLVVASKPAHDVCVVRLLAAIVVVGSVEDG